MSEYTYTLPDGHEARVFDRNTVWGTFTRAFAFEPDGSDIVAEATETQYVDYCRSCRHALTIGRMFPGRFNDDMSSITGDCACDDW